MGGYSSYSYGSKPDSLNKGSYADGLGENYVFHGVESYKGPDSIYNGENGYASKFAAFIIENNLGDVFGGKAVNNHRYHTNHWTKVFVWNPDREAVKAWWEIRRPKAATPPIVIQNAAVVPIVAPAAVEVAKPKKVSAKVSAKKEV